MSRRPDRHGVGVAGLGIAVCAACCAGPILGFITATGLVALAVSSAFGAAGLLVLVPAAPWWHGRCRRQRAAACAAADEPVPVDIARAGRGRRHRRRTVPVPRHPGG